jgi:hypothetical protein
MSNNKNEEQLNQSSLTRGKCSFFLLDASLVFVFLISVYLLTYSGAFRADDEHILAARAQSWAFRGHLDYPQVYGNDRVRHLALVQESEASPVVAIEPGQAYIGAILFRIASLIGVGGSQAFFLLNLYATALTGGVTYLCVRALRFSRGTGIITGIVYGLCTMAWPYSKTAFRDPLASLMVLIMFLGWMLIAGDKKMQKYYGMMLFAIGFFVAMAVKGISIVVFPAFILSGILSRIIHKRSHPVRKHWIYAGLTAGIIILIIATFSSNLGPFARFSFDYYLERVTFYLENLSFSSLFAFFGPFISPAKSLFLFSPVLILQPWVTIKHWRSYSHFALPVIFTVILLAIIQALQLGEQWGGTLFWGLRYMLPALPLLTILLTPWFEWFLKPPYDLRHLGGVFLLLISFFVQVAGAIVSWGSPFRYWVQQGLNPYTPEAVWDINFQVIPVHFHNLFNPDAWDVGWVRALLVNPTSILIPFLVLFTMLCSIFIVLNKFKSSQTQLVLGLGILLVALTIPFYPTLQILKTDPATGGNSPELIELIEVAKARVSSNDLVIVDSYGTHLWTRMMNDWSISVPWYSLPFEIPGTEAVGWKIGGQPSQSLIQFVTSQLSNERKLLYLSSSEAPDFFLEREEQWLGKHFQLVNEFIFTSRQFAILQIYSNSQLME